METGILSIKGTPIVVVVWIGVIAFALSGCGSAPFEEQVSANAVDAPDTPQQYVAYRTEYPLELDGVIDEAAWQAAPWTHPFVDIEGDLKPLPRYATRAKILWDDTFLYIAAEMEEPNLWNTYTERDAVIFHENDFEVFLDPDGDTQAYYELEVNALETAWDLLLTRTYRDGGRAIDGWDIAGLEVHTEIRGTLNTPGDTDDGWTVEMALPWHILREAAPGRRPPKAGEQWRVNFSRVEWRLTVEGGQYVKALDPATGQPYPPDNWVWSPQGVIDMHRPERWGYVQFSNRIAGEGDEPFAEDPNRSLTWRLRELYHRQRTYHNEHGVYATTLHALHYSDLFGDPLPKPTLQVTQSMYEITLPGYNGTTLHIRQDGKSWTSENSQ